MKNVSTFKPLFTSALIFSFAAPGFADFATSTITLPDNQWMQIGLPLDPVFDNTVTDIFGDNLTAADYGTTWAIFSWDPVAGVYVDPGINGELAQGIGYWMIQQTGASVDVDLTSGIPSPPTAPQQIFGNPHPACPPAAFSCFEIPLSAANPAPAITWNMIATPFNWDVIWNQGIISTDSGVCSDADGCTVSEAEAAGIFHNEAWNYNGATYDTIVTNTSIPAWTGMWTASLGSAPGTNPVLLVPAYVGGQ